MPELLTYTHLEALDWSTAHGPAEPSSEPCFSKEADPSSSTLYEQSQSTSCCAETQPSRVTTPPQIHMHGYTQLATVKDCYAVSQCEEKAEKCIYR